MVPPPRDIGPAWVDWVFMAVILVGCGAVIAIKVWR